MDNDTNPTSQSSSKTMPIAITIAVIVIIVVAAVAFMASQNNQTPQDAMVPQNQTQTTPVPTTGEAMDSMQASEYRDGEYTAEGNYTSPGGAESIDVTMTLADGVVTDAEVVSNATRPISKQMQASFIGGFKEQVIGKNIDEINLTKVSASSLAPKGFNDAVSEIKAQAGA